jgi:hypothetical protein
MKKAKDKAKAGAKQRVAPLIMITMVAIVIK